MKTYGPNKKGFRFDEGGRLLSPWEVVILTLNRKELDPDEASLLAKTILKAIDDSEEFL